MKTLLERDGYINRHLHGVPTTEVLIELIYKDIDGEHAATCVWHPYDPTEYPADHQPAKGYLGTAEALLGHGIGRHAWEQNDSEFIYYKIISDENKGARTNERKL